MTVLRKILKKSAFMAALATTLAAVLLTVSCSGLVDIDNSSGSDAARISISVGDISARDAIPDFTADDFCTYKLTYKSGTTSKSKQWTSNAETQQTAYQMMNNEVFSIPLGTYTFILTANDAYGTLYKGTIENREVTADTNLSFTLKYNRSSDGASGYLALNVSYPKENVKKLVVSAYASTDVDTYTSATKTALSTQTGSNITGTYTLSSKTMTSGAYIVEFLFYGGENSDIQIGKWLRYAYITGGKISTDTFAIDSLDDVYTITYPAEATVTGAKTISFTPRMDVELPASDKVTRTGYTFDGWYASVDEDGNPTGEPITGWTKGTKTDNVTVYAKWTTNSYPVKFYTNLPADGELSDNPFATQPVPYNGNASVPETMPERDGYTFVRWTDNANGTAFDFENTAVAGEKALYAVWSYDVTFNKNADDATGTMEAQTLYASWLWNQNSVTLTTNTFEYEGHSFLGWADAADATEADYADGSALTAATAKTLYAVWHDDSTGFVVSFETRGGSPVAVQTVAADGTATEPDNCTKEGYLLTGWYTSTDDGATLSETAYDFTTPVTANLKLYAKWFQNAYYVSTTGNNTSGNGTKEAPYATVAKAVAAINSVGNADTDFAVVVSGELKERVTLSTDLTTDKAKTLTIRGLTGCDTDKLNGSAAGRVLTIETSVPVTIDSLTIKNGSKVGSGNGILISSSSSLVLRNSIVTENKFSSTDYYTLTGGAVCNDGTLVMESGSINGNRIEPTIRTNQTSSVYGKGGGVYNKGTFIMKGGSITGNTVYVTSSYSTNTYQRHYAYAYGGGVYNDTDGTFSMEGGTISGNSVYASGYSGSYYQGGSVYNSGTFKMGGDAYIPYTRADNTNTRYSYDVVYIGSTIITVTSSLTSQTPVATIQPTYSSGITVIAAAEDVTLAEEALKFACANASYRVTEEGKLASRSSYTISYYLNGGTHETGYPTSHGTGETVLLKGATKAGYTFGGWYTTSGFSGEPLTAVDDTYTTITLYARWVEIPYFTITYKDAGGGAYSGSNSGSLISKHHEGETETLVNAAKTNYVFDGWYTSDDNGVTLSDEPVTQLTDENCTADLTLYSKWKPHYVITYKDSLSGSAYTSLGASYYYFNEGDAAKTLPTNVTKTDYIFDGWRTSSNGGVTLSEEKITVLNDTNCTQDITLYAKWIPYYTVTYKDRDGAIFSGVYTNGTPRNTYYSGDSNTWNVPAVTKEGSLFMGWFLESDCSGAKVTTLKNLKGDVTLYAWWQVPNVTVTVGTGDITVAKTVDDEDTVVLTAADGYKNYSWLIREDGVDVDATTIISGSSVSEDGKTFTVNKETMATGHVYIVRVVAQNKYGILYSTNITIKK